MTGTPAASGSRTPVFAWITGERTNTGDSLLRRPYVAALRGIGPLRLWINRSEPDFLSGLGLDGSETRVASFPRWYFGLMASALRRRTVLVLNAGEFRVHASRVGLLLALLIASQILRLRGGSTLWIGVSVPATGHRLLRIPVRWAGRHLEYVQWRDDASCITAAPRSVGPDWAFAAGTPTGLWPTTGRTRCAFVLRGDRPEPSSAWLLWARSLCADHGLDPVVVVQVRQDAPRARLLAAALGADVVDWPEDSSHAAQEERLRELYRTCRIVVGDRLHGVVIGATEGAVPLGWVESSTGKIDRHFRVIGLAYPGEHEGHRASELPRIPVELLKQRAVNLAMSIDAARECLFDLQDRLSSLGAQSRPEQLESMRRNHGRRTRSRAARNASE